MSRTYTDTKPVMQGHLEEWHAALHAAFTYHEADDVRSEAKNVGGVHRRSHLTTRLAKALDRIEGYVTQENEDGTFPEA